MPRTPPSFDNAVSRPTLDQIDRHLGNEGFSQTRTQCNEELHAPHIIQQREGGGALWSYQLLVEMSGRFGQTIAHPDRTMAIGSNAVSSSGIGSRGRSGLRSPFAKSARACRAEESSPIWIRVLGLRARLSKSKPPVL